jgi:RimJ/RimL family protein N-acetyltransferase
MSTTFETERLILRPFRAGDLTDIYEQVYSDPDVCIYYCGPTRTKAKTRRWLHYRITEAEYSDFYAWAVELKETGKVIGLVRLGPYVDSFGGTAEEPAPPFNPVEVELSFAFGRSYWGQGYALEASRRIIDHAFGDLRLPRLLGGVARQNLRSVRFHEKLGYRVTKNLIDDDFVAALDNPWPRQESRDALPDLQD